MKKIILMIGAFVLAFSFISSNKAKADDISYQNLIDTSKVILNNEGKYYYDGKISLDEGKNYSFVASKEFFGNSYDASTRNLLTGNTLVARLTDDSGNHEFDIDLNWYFLGIFGAELDVEDDSDLYIDDFLVRDVEQDNLLKNQVILYEGRLVDFKGFCNGPYLGDYDLVTDKKITITTLTEDPITLSFLRENLFAYDTTDGILREEITNNQYQNVVELGEYVVGFSAQDSSNNVVTYEANIDLQDQTPPVITKIKPMFWTLGSNPPELADFNEYFSVSDDYDPDPYFFDLEYLSSYSYKQEKAVTVKLYARDKSGNVTSITDGFSLKDLTGPTIEANDAIVWSMEAEKPTLDEIKALFTVSDDFDVNAQIVSFKISPTYVKNIIKTYTIGVTAKDKNENETTSEFDFNVQDLTPPVITRTNYIKYKMGDNPPDLDYFKDYYFATDNYDNNPEIFDVEYLSNYYYKEEKAVTIKLYAKDASGNVGTLTDGFSIVDLTPPVITQREDIIWSIDNNMPTLEDLMNYFDVTDNYDENAHLSKLTINGIYVKDEEKEYAINLEAVDANGNVGYFETTFITKDITPPTITRQTWAGQTFNWELDKPVPTLEDMTFEFILTDNYDSNPYFYDYELLGEYVNNVEIEIPFVIYAKDSNGNIGSYECTITILDRTAPKITLKAPLVWSLDEECPTLEDFIDIIKVTDNYDPNPTVVSLTFSDSQYVKGVIKTYSVKIVAKDKNDNRRTLNTTIKVTDITAPKILRSSYLEYPLGAETPDLETIKEHYYATDNYDNNPEIYKFELLSDYSYDVEKSVAIKLYARDAYGNIGTVTDGFAIKDLTAPTISQNSEILWSLDEEAPTMDDLISYFSVSDNYDQSATITKILVSNYQKGKIHSPSVRVEAEDANGNVGIFTTTIMVTDLTAPRIYRSSYLEYPLGEEIPDLTTIKEHYYATDNYDNNPEIYDFELLSDYAYDVEKSIAIKLYAKDVYGNIGTLTDGFSLKDMTAPTIVEVEKMPWKYLATMPTLDDFVSYYQISDNYDLSAHLTSVTINQNQYNNAKPNQEVGVILYATDQNGNIGSLNTTFVIKDMTKPSFVSPNNLIWELGKGAPTVEELRKVVQATDDYDPNPELRAYEIAGSFIDKVGTYAIKYYIYDNSDNMFSGTFGFEIVDTTSPLMTLKELTVNLSSLGDFMVNYDHNDAIVTLEDLSGIASLDSYISSNANAKNYFVGDLELTVTAKDPYGNGTTLKTKVTVIDDLAPDVYLKTGLIETTTKNKITIEEIVRRLSKIHRDKGEEINDIKVLDCSYIGKENKAGSYEIRYMYKQNDENCFGKVTISVLEVYEENIENPSDVNDVNDNIGPTIIDNQNVNQATTEEKYDYKMILLIALSSLAVLLFICLLLSKKRKKVINK